MATSEVGKHKHCRFEFQDAVQPPVDDGLVIINGPHATLYAYEDGGRGTPQQIDRLTKVKVVRQGEDLVLTGESEFLLHEVRVVPAEARLSVTVTPRKGCSSCG